MGFDSPRLRHKDCIMLYRVLSDVNNYCEIADRGHGVEFDIIEVAGDRDIVIRAYEDSGYASQTVVFRIKPEEATALKEFLIASGY